MKSCRRNSFQNKLKLTYLSLLLNLVILRLFLSLLALSPVFLLLRRQQTVNLGNRKFSPAVLSGTFLLARTRNLARFELQLAQHFLAQAVLVQETAAFHQPQHRHVVYRQLRVHAIALVVLFRGLILGLRLNIILLCKKETLLVFFLG